MKENSKLTGGFNKSATMTNREISIRQKQDRVNNFIEGYYERNSKRFEQKAFDSLWKKEGNLPQLKPDGVVNDRKDQLVRASKIMVQNEKSNQRRKVNQIANRLIARGKGYDFDR